MEVHAGSKRKRHATDIIVKDIKASSNSDNAEHSGVEEADGRISTMHNAIDCNDEFSRLPSCTICMQPYVKRTYLQPCYHSYCFMCIRYWINIAPTCPLCKQGIDSLVYNIDERTNSFQEYFLAGNKSHNPSPERPVETRLDRVAQQRHRIYRALSDKAFDNTIYPPAQRLHAQVQYVTPELLPKASIFATREVPAVLGRPCDEDILSHIKALLMVPYDTNKSRQRQQRQQRKGKALLSSPLDPASDVTMEYTDLLDELGRWLNLADKSADGNMLARRFVKELMAFLRSGLDYWTYVSRVQYPEED
ncbi:hypothetical protein BX666DRAFT_2031775 [Dichotomocladium elegans]|nr:hypothetical protein BX666DRAFT_2031775 [Dichotomocladium elegans]